MLKPIGARAMIETIEFDAPAHWASALINGDCSSFEDEDQEQFDAWREDNLELYVVDCSAEPHIARWNGLQTELLTYTAHIQGDAP